MIEFHVMTENQNPTLEEVLKELEEAKKRIALLEEKIDSKDQEISRQSEELNKQSEELNRQSEKIQKQSIQIDRQKNQIMNLKEQISSLMGEKFASRAEGYVPEIKDEEFNKESVITPPSAENPKEKPIFREHDKSKVVYLEEENARTKTCGRGKFGPEIPTKELRLKLPEDEMYCKCGARLRVIGTETTDKVEAPPQRFRIIRIVREKCQCPVCEGITYSEKSVVKTAPVEKTLFPKTMATPSFVAHLIYNKYGLHIPYYRQQYALKYRHLDISRENMNNWQETAFDGLQTLKEVMHEEVISGNVIHADETPVKVINQNPEEIRKELGLRDKDDLKDREKCYIWVLMGGKENHPVIEYNFRWSRSKNNVEPLIEGFSGFMMTDGLSHYNTTADEYNQTHDNKIIHCSCNAHARRKYYDAWKNGNDLDAEPALDYYHEIYVAERELRRQYERKKITAEEFVKKRKEKVLPVFADFKKWVEEIQPKVRPGSKLGKAVNYSLNRWDRLLKYLDSAELTPDNNECEAVGIRPFTVGRNNWKFNYSGEGAKSSCFMFSLIQTAKANGLNPEDYLRNVFEQAPFCETREDWRKLLPWNIEMKPFEDRGEWI